MATAIRGMVRKYREKRKKQERIRFTKKELDCVEKTVQTVLQNNKSFQKEGHDAKGRKEKTV